jgi:CHAT domain-containing protein
MAPVVGLLIIQSGSRAVLSQAAPPPPDEGTELRELRRQGNVLFRGGEYLRAIQIYENGYRKATDRGLKQSAARFLNNLGGAYYQMFRYRDAIQVYLEARDLAISQGDREAWGALCNNLSSLYFQMGDSEAALASAGQGLQLPREVTAKYRPQLLIQYARIKWQQNHSGQALQMLHQAIDASRAQIDAAAEAQAWNELGNALLETSNLQLAENALLEAYRLRKLNGNERIYFAYESLGKLRQRQGDLRSAEVLFDRALEAAQATSPSAVWSIYYERGQLKRVQARWLDAYADFGAALECLHRWRTEILPADVFRVSAEVDLQRVYSAYIELASRLYAETGRKQYAEQAFGAAEESRAASLRALWAGSDLTRTLPAEYWEALASLHRAEAAVVKGGPAADASAVRSRRLKVAELEARAALDFRSHPSAGSGDHEAFLDKTRRALQPSEVYLGFHLGEPESYLWVIAREGFSLRPLPSATKIAARVAAFERAVREGSSSASELAQRVYFELFGGTDARLMKKPKWIVAPDGALFELPFAALMEPPATRGGVPSYLVERHAVQIVPGSWTLFDATVADWNGPLAGLGDPIYNRADPRLPRPAVRTAVFKGNENGRPHLELARLAGSSREIENCARVWRSHGYDPVLLRGAEATKDNLDRVLQRSPVVVHVAAHLLFPPDAASPGLLALAQGAGHDVELISASEISGMRLRLGLIVLNGCHSAHGAALPGAGLMGMTRAWLAAGARAVIVTRWNTSDQDEGRLFQSFYERFSVARREKRRKRFSELLREAQIDELRAGGRRANPAYWAAYFCVERN